MIRCRPQPLFSMWARSDDHHEVRTAPKYLDGAEAVSTSRQDWHSGGPEMVYAVSFMSLMGDRYLAAGPLRFVEWLDLYTRDNRSIVNLAFQKCRRIANTDLRGLALAHGNIYIP